MKAKTIKAILRKKIDDWTSSIEDEALRKAVRADTIVTGGCIASMLLKEKVNDFDIYFRTHATALAIANYYTKRFVAKNKAGIQCAIHVFDEEDKLAPPQKIPVDDTNPLSPIQEFVDGPRPRRIRIVVKSAGIASEDGSTQSYEYFEGRPDESVAAAGYVGEVMQDPGDIQDAYDAAESAALDTEDAPDDGLPRYRPIFLSTNAITLSGRIQLILRFYGEPDAIHENYDFSHCTNYWTSRGEGDLVLRPAALECLLARELRYVGSRYPICSLIRVRKFTSRGWTINAGQVLKMCMQVSQLDLRNPRILEDQLTGVDVAYFMQVIHLLNAKDPQKVDYAYLIEIIDRMF